MTDLTISPLFVLPGDAFVNQYGQILWVCTGNPVETVTTSDGQVETGIMFPVQQYPHGEHQHRIYTPSDQVEFVIRQIGTLRTLSLPRHTIYTED